MYLYMLQQQEREKSIVLFSMECGCHAANTFYFRSTMFMHFSEKNHLTNYHLHLHGWHWFIGNAISNAPQINGLAIGFRALNKRNSWYMYVCVFLMMRLDNWTYVSLKKNGCSLTMGNKLHETLNWFQQNFLFHNLSKTYRKSNTLLSVC